MTYTSTQGLMRALSWIAALFFAALSCLYQQGKIGWLYCDEKMSEDEANAWNPQDENGYDKVKSRCIPNKPVFPDMSTAAYSPFPKPKRLAK